MMIVLSQTFSKWVVVLQYEINKDYIAKNICVNRTKPSCCCKGKCFLAKKLASDENRQQAPGKGGERDQSAIQWFPAPGNNGINSYWVFSSAVRHEGAEGIIQNFSNRFFKPPRVNQRSILL